MFEARPLAGAGGFIRDVRFVLPEEAAGKMTIAEDPLTRAFEDGFAAGSAQAREEAEAQWDERDAARERIELALHRLDADQARLLEDRLRAMVLALCGSALAPLAIDPAGLTRRIEAALGLLRRVEDHRVLRLHPEDLALVAGHLPHDLRAEPDPALTRGEIRIETDSGGVEDGPDQWRLALAEALGQ